MWYMAAAVRFDVKSEQRTKKNFFLLQFISWTINLVLSHILQQTFASEKDIYSLIQFFHSVYACRDAKHSNFRTMADLSLSDFTTLQKRTKWPRYEDTDRPSSLPNLCERLAGANYSSWPAWGCSTDTTIQYTQGRQRWVQRVKHSIFYG